MSIVYQNIGFLIKPFRISPGPVRGVDNSLTVGTLKSVFDHKGDFSLHFYEDVLNTCHVWKSFFWFSGVD